MVATGPIECPAYGLAVAEWSPVYWARRVALKRKAKYHSSFQGTESKVMRSLKYFNNCTVLCSTSLKPRKPRRVMLITSSPHGMDAPVYIETPNTKKTNYDKEIDD